MTPASSFMELLKNAWKENNSLVCAGLDPVPEKMPPCVMKCTHPVFEFNKAIIDATKNTVCAYKPQAAMYEGVGAEEDLEKTINYIHENAPGIPVILDAKRADIGNTSAMYAKEAFERYGADAVTVNPYLGRDALKPFLDRAEKGVIILCRTSNPGAKEVQELRLESGEPLYLRLAKLIAEEWNANGNVMLVAGATFPGELGAIRKAAGDMPLLVPGIGAQGGDLEGVLKNGLTAEKTGLVINSSRGIIFASNGDDFASAAAAAALDLKNKINRFREN